MTRTPIFLAASALLVAKLVACGGDDASDASGTGGAGTGGAGTGGAGTGGTAGTGGAAGAATGGTAGVAAGGGGTAGAPACDQIPALVAAYKAAHPGNGGKDWDIVAKTPQQLAADPEAQQLLALCEPDQRPVIPELAWEYGGNDHPWINPQASASVYCVYIPVVPSTEHWQYDAVADHVTADVYVKCPDQNPCKDEVGADQVLACLGDASNIEILVDTASLNDGISVGLLLSEASTDLELILPDSSKVHLYTGL